MTYLPRLIALTLVSVSFASQGRELTLQLDTSLQKKRFVRLGYAAVVPQGSSSEVRDLDGPLIRYGDSQLPGLATQDPQVAAALSLLEFNIRRDHPSDFANQGLGAPRGSTADVKGGGTPLLTIGTYLDDARRWSVEAFALGLPIKGTVYGKGRIGGEGSDSVNLGKIGTSEQLGPLVIGRYHFGKADDTWRFNVGLAGSYIVFFNTRTSESLENFVGGNSKIKIKNAWGFGAVVGASYQIDDRWSLHATVGKMKMSTKATLTTNTDPEVAGRSLAVLQSGADVGTNTLSAIDVIVGGLTQEALNDPDRNQIPAVLARIAQFKTGNASSMGKLRRQLDVKLDPLLFNVSVGYDF
jgi:outer membrane protein W